MTTEATRRKRAGWPATLDDLPRRRVKLKSDVSTGRLRLAAGFELEIDGFAGSRWDRLNLTGDACECCGVKVRAQLGWTSLTILPAAEAPELEGMR